ncbi:tRNA-2-methylthio-N(6)-dimethylallyladenosine synthase [Candidatus Tiddalikarchaeum anstoanum]|nr:tRNA-2-methylthio-N(6)-dimethylallyladenosine synthase [Candidatus Tiddalikarchaeum anstoanum]
MKIVLINCLSFGGSNFEPPIGITMIGGYLKEHGIDVSIIDAEILNWDNNRVENEIKKIKPQIVGVTSITYNRFEALDMLKRAKKLGYKTVYGGVHATFMGEEIMQDYPFIDIVVFGEGEDTMLDICRGKKLGEIEGIIFRDGKKIRKNQPRLFIQDIDALPYGWDLLPMEKYKYFGVFASRGCPFDCTFCASPKLWNRKLRTRSAKKVVDEIEYLINKYGKKRIHIKDDTFTARKSWAIEICNEIIKRKLDLEWECLGRVDTVDEELLKKLKSAGCVMIEYGVESGNNEILKSINKMITVEKVIKAIRITEKVGLDYTTFFIIGHPGDNEKTINDTFNIAWKLRPQSLSFCPLDIFPGSRVYDIAVEKGLLKKFSWTDENYKNKQGQTVPRFQNPSLDEAKLEEYAKRFYMRYALYTLMDIKDSKSLKYLFLNEYVPFHFLLKNGYDLRLFFIEFKNAVFLKSHLIKKVLGFLILPFFLLRIILNYAKTLWRKIKNVL